MRIAIAAQENHDRSLINERFGRCDWFCIYDAHARKAKYIENPNRYSDDDAGMECVTLLSEHKITAVVAGRFGSKVVALLNKNSIQMIIPDQTRTIREIIELFDNRKK